MSEQRSVLRGPGHGKRPAAPGEYLDIDACEHVLHDLRGGCSGCNYDVESIIGHLEHKRDRERELADALGRALEASEIWQAHILGEDWPEDAPSANEAIERIREGREALRQWREARKGDSGP